MPIGKPADAIKAFEKFLETSQSDDEKYIARLRMAECYVALKRNDKAADSLRYAVGLKPFFPDAYIALGKLYYDMGNYTDALPILKHSLTIKPPYYQIMVYNPRDYDFTPLKWLAYTYLAANQPILAYECFKQMLEITPKDEKLKDLVAKMEKMASKHEEMIALYAKIKDLPKDKLKKELDKIPEDWRSEPMFTNLRNLNFIKEESSGKDMVILCGYTTRQWTPEALEEGIGGSEEAVIYLAREYAKHGWNVTVYNNCGHKRQVFDGVTYAPFWEWNYRDKQDVTILWRHPKMADYDINSTKVYLDMHDVVNEGEFNAKRLSKIDKIFVKSEFHRSLFPNIPDEKFAVIQNGINVSEFDEPEERDPYLLINTSSPDRSLSTLLRLYERVKEQVPEAKLEWAYGWNNYDTILGKDPRMAEWKDKQVAEMKRLGVIERGRISHKDVASMYKRGRVFAYPTEFAEIDCISARKAQAGGALPITTDFAALKETVRQGITVHSKKTKDTWCKPYQFDFGLDDKEAEDEWVEAVVTALKSTLPFHVDMSEFDWPKIAERWLNEI